MNERASEKPLYALSSPELLDIARTRFEKESSIRILDAMMIDAGSINLDMRQRIGQFSLEVEKQMGLLGDVLSYEGKDQLVKNITRIKKERDRSVSGLVGSLIRNGHIRVGDIDSEGNIKNEALASSEYFQERPFLREVLEGYQLGKRSKLRKIAQKNEHETINIKKYLIEEIPYNRGENVEVNVEEGRERKKRKKGPGLNIARAAFIGITFVSSLLYGIHRNEDGVNLASAKTEDIGSPTPPRAGEGYWEDFLPRGDAAVRRPTPNFDDFWSGNSSGSGDDFWRSAPTSVPTSTPTPTPTETPFPTEIAQIKENPRVPNTPTRVLVEDKEEIIVPPTSVPASPTVVKTPTEKPLIQEDSKDQANRLPNAGGPPAPSGKYGILAALGLVSTLSGLVLRRKNKH
ncbi:hypothetical protein C4577_04615 [Candidatus Parcubacteria bacterium]|nr:MAG: hypothetical protein C4577_04615 [Candidatus Parcubacteria bacterium]